VEPLILEKHNKCVLCDGERFFSFCVNNNLLFCTNCKLVFDKNVWKDSANEAFEKEWFGEGYNLGRSFWIKLFESWKNKQTWKRLMKTVFQGNKLLEIGVGSGAFLNYMKTKGFEVAGCDLSDAVCKHAQNTFDISIHCGFVFELPSDARYDVIVINHVLEHVNNPVKFLLDVKARLKQNGILHLAVPNIASWGARLKGWNCYEPYHLIYFSPDTLRRVIEMAGFNVVLLSTCESFSGWFLSIFRTLLKINQKSADFRQSQKILRSKSWIEHIYRLSMIFTGIVTFPLRYIQSRLGFGDEVTVIVRRYDNVPI